jgi:transposase
VLTLDARSRMRAALAFDVVLFVAACPTCGGEAEWMQQREDTRLRTQITCATPYCLP